jgi:gliding motility-associated-like protein
MRKLLVFIQTIVMTFSLQAVELPAQLDYIKNNGQWEQSVLYKADLRGGWVFLEKNALTYLFLDSKEMHHQHQEGNEKYIEINGVKTLNPNYKEAEKSARGHAYQMSWLQSNPLVKIVEKDKQPYFNNYFLGNDPSKWQSAVGLYNSVFYTNLYQQIDARIYSQAQSMKTDYIIHKEGNPTLIKMEYKGADAIKVDESGRLIIQTSVNTVNELKPYAYQYVNGMKQEVKCAYKLNGNIVTFHLPEGYDNNNDLIIDPTLIFSTYSGSFGDNWGSSATHDAAGNMFLGGIALDVGFPTTLGAFQTSFSGGSGFNITDIAITKFNSTGTARLYSTYLGGSSNELLSSLYCTPSNELIAVISTSSTNFPTSADAFDKTFNGGGSTVAIQSSIEFPNGSDIAVTKFNAAGTGLVGSTYFGGTSNDGLNLHPSTLFNYGDDTRNDIALDNSGNIYIVSTTSSSNIPGTTGKAQPSIGGGSYDGVVAKFNSGLSSLNWATYYGGSGADAAYSISLDIASNIFICGGTNSSNLPGRTNGLNTTYRGGTTDGYVAKLDNNGNSVLAATYLGTAGYDQAYLMDLDKNDNIYIFGQTLGSYPVTAGVYSNANSNQFLHKLNNDLNTTAFSTVFGRPNYSLVNISPTALLVDICGNIYAAGWGGGVNSGFQPKAGTTAQMPVTADAYKSSTDNKDFYFINLNQNASSLKYASYFGENGGVGDHVDGGTSRFDKNGIIYQAVCASCNATNSFPVTAGTVGQNNNSINCNMAGFKFKFDLTGLQIITAAGNPSAGCSPLSVNFTYTATQPATQFFWNFGDGSTSTAEFPSHTFNNPGTYTVKLVIKDPNNCNPADSATFTITVREKKINPISRTICEGQSVTVGNQTFNTTGTYSVTLQTTQGCDSVVNLNLVVNPTKSTSISRTICQGQSVTIGNQTFNQTGNFSVTLQTSANCDSIVSLNLTVKQPFTTNISRTICQGQSVTVGTQTFNQTGVFTVLLQSSDNCDSTVILNLTVNPPVATTISRTICQGQSVTIGNQTFNQTGTFSVTLVSSQNCDSIVTLNLSVNDVLTTQLNQTVCTGGSVNIGNQTFNTTGSYSVTLTSAQRCDSIVNLQLLVTDTIVANITASICEGERYFIGNQVFTASGDYSVYLTAAAGCDSTVHLSLTVNNIARTTIDRIICDNDSVVIGTQVFKDAGTYTVTLTSSQQCDSIITLNLTVNPTRSTDVFSAICEGDSVSIGTQIFRETGVYTIPLQTTVSCDSNVTLHLTVNPLKRTNFTESICEGSSYSFNNQILTEPGDYLQILSTSLDCDSIVTLTLIVHPNVSIDIVREICEGDSVTIGTQSFKETGNYIVKLLSSFRCDSTVNLSLTVHPPKSTQLERTICAGDSVMIGNQTFKEDGNYVVILNTSKGCDSTVFLTLNVNSTPVINASVDKSIVLPGEAVQLDVTASGSYSFNWTPAGAVSNPLIANPTATVNTPTWFVVRASDITTECASVDSVFVDVEILPCVKENIFIPNAFSPNGDGINDHFVPRSTILLSMRLQVYDRWGNKVFESNDPAQGWDGTYKGQPAQVDAYGYHFTGTCTDGGNITLKGNVTLLR